MIKGINLQLFGGGRWEPDTFSTYSATHISSKATVHEIYTSKHMDPALNPKGVAIRESCDSVDNPKSRGLIVVLDVTGSMGSLSNVMARTGLKTLAEEVYNRKPITDPHIMFMAVGDVAAHDDAPLQVTQFEADIRIAEQLTKIYLEGGGGGNHFESYDLAWYFAGNHTRLDCFEKRQEKGFLFTIGDEPPSPGLTRGQIETVMGYRPQADLTAEELLTMASRQYEVFHLIVEEGNHVKVRGIDAVYEPWKKLLGQRAIKLSDHTKMAEVIVSILQLEAGVDKAAITKSWDGSTGLVVAKAIDSLAIGKVTTDAVVKF